MSEHAIPADKLDLHAIQDPDVRRTLRDMYDRLCAMVLRQQVEIDALVEMMMEKHLGSLGEFKRHIIRLQQNAARGNRIHEAVAAAEDQSHQAAAPAPAAPAPGSHTPT